MTTLAELHIAGKTNYRVMTDGTGRSYIVAPLGDQIHGHLPKLLKLANVAGWTPLVVSGKQWIPTYAYDRLVVAGLGCIVQPATENEI